MQGQGNSDPCFTLWNIPTSEFPYWIFKYAISAFAAAYVIHKSISWLGFRVIGLSTWLGQILHTHTRFLFQTIPIRDTCQYLCEFSCKSENSSKRRLYKVFSQNRHTGIYLAIFGIKMPSGCIFTILTAFAKTVFNFIPNRNIIILTFLAYQFPKRKAYLGKNGHTTGITSSEIMKQTTIKGIPAFT